MTKAMDKPRAAETIQPSILIIEDDIDTRDMLSRLLTAEGYSVRVAANGWEGLLAMESPPHLVLLDMMLPGMDGFMFLKSMRGQRTFQAIPVVVLTAMDADDVTSRVLQLGVEHVISKGDSVYPKLRTAIKVVLGRPRPHARVSLPEPGSMIRPYLDVYLKMLAWSCEVVPFPLPTGLPRSITRPNAQQRHGKLRALRAR